MRNRASILAVVLCVSACAAQDVSIAIHADKRASYRIPRTIFGTFLEPIGNSIYGGLWAQLLENPSLEDNLWSAGQLRRKLDAEPALYRASELGLPIPWQPLDAREGARYEPRWGDAANSQRSLAILGLPQGQTGIRQQVYLPLHRTLRYNGSFYAKCLNGAAEVEVSVRERNRSDKTLARALVPVNSDKWTRYTFALTLEAGQLAPLEPADFALAVSNGARILVDQIFLFPSDAVDGMDPDMLAMAREMDTPLVRFGGNYTSAYHWRDGIGPMEARVSMLNLAWGMPEYNHFGTDEFLDFCRRIGAQPQIALNLGTGTPQEAAGWVRYVNEHWGDRRGGLLWELGNELWGTFQTGYPTLAKIAGLTRAFSEAVHGTDPRARLIATGADPDHFETWNAAQLANPPGTFDFLSTHFVVGTAEMLRPQADADFTAKADFALPVELERRLRAMHRQIASAHGNAGIAFTEWLFHANNDTAPRFNNMGGAVCTAGFLNMMMRVADIVPISDMTGIIEFGGIWKKRGRVYGVPAYWAFRMYARTEPAFPVQVNAREDMYEISQGNRRLPDIAQVPYVDTVAALNASGDRLIVFCVNRHLHRNAPVSFTMDGFRAKPIARIQTLASGSIYDANSEDNPEHVRPVESTLNFSGGRLNIALAPASVTVIQLERQ